MPDMNIQETPDRTFFYNVKLFLFIIILFYAIYLFLDIQYFVRRLNGTGYKRII